MRKLGLIVFPLVWLMARAPGKKDMCMVTLIAMCASFGLWAAVIAGAVRVIA